MSDPFAIAFDRQARLLRLTLNGLWSPLTVASFTAHLLVTATRERFVSRPVDVLSDSRRFAVQTGTVAAAFEGLMAKAANHGAGRTAIVVGSSLNKLQAERTLASPNVRVFLAMDEAEQWLAGSTAAAAPRAAGINR